MNSSEFQPMQRRPIQSRNTRWAAAGARWLAQWGVSPNGISLFGVFAAAVAGAAFGLTSSVDGMGQRALWFCGGICCQVRLLCNLFDGMVAMEQQTASRQGELYNEVPDRVSDTAIFVGLGFAARGNVTLGFAAALTCVFVAYVRAASTSIGCPADFSGPLAKPQRMALATLLAVYMALTLGVSPVGFGEPAVVLVVVCLGGLFTACRRLVRAYRFLEERDHDGA